MLCYAVRHAESTVNAGLGGGVDCDLTPLGMSQARALCDRLEHARPVALYSSPYRRAIRTAEPLARRLGLPVRIQPELCEFHPATSDNLSAFSPPDLQAICREFDFAAPAVESMDEAEVGAPALVGDPTALWTPLGESVEQLIERSRRFARFLKRRFTGLEDTLVVFGHGSPIARLIDAWLTDTPGPSFRFLIDNASLNVLRCHEGVSSLVCLNESSHLTTLPAPSASYLNANRVIKPAPPTAYW